jgi:hypothetical protein
MSDSFRIWWVEMEPRVWPLAAIIVGLLLAFAIGKLVTRSR